MSWITQFRVHTLEACEHVNDAHPLKNGRAPPECEGVKEQDVILDRLRDRGWSVNYGAGRMRIDLFCPCSLEKRKACLGY